MVVGTGNEGEAGGHTGGWLTEGEEKTLELAIGEYETGTNIQLWKSYVDNFSVSLISPEGMTIGPFREIWEVSVTGWKGQKFWSTMENQVPTAWLRKSIWIFFPWKNISTAVSGKSV